jgi:translation elongation factor EF-Ts
MELSKTTEEEVEMQEEVMLDIAEESGIPPESFRKIVRNRMQKMEEEI